MATFEWTKVNANELITLYEERPCQYNKKINTLIGSTEGFGGIESNTALLLSSRLDSAAKHSSSEVLVSSRADWSRVWPTRLPLGLFISRRSPSLQLEVPSSLDYNIFVHIYMDTNPIA